jgi:acyl-CoA dehydrogenase
VSILRHLLTGETGTSTADVGAWWARFEASRSRFARPIERALAGGLSADRVAWAFASGYQAAIERLFGVGGPSALCATEKEGAHPRHIATLLTPEGDRLRLRGRKHFVTLGPAAQSLYVIASRGMDGDRNDLVAVRVAPGPGVHCEALPPFPFVPEVPHGRLELDALVDPSAVLPGDGYLDYLKPFRTVEDIHVVAALTGHMIGLARRFAMARATVEGLLAQAATLETLADQSPSDGAVHLALAGALAQFERAADAMDRDRLDVVTRAGWERDRALLGVAAQARELRRAAAWARFDRA